MISDCLEKDRRISTSQLSSYPYKPTSFPSPSRKTPHRLQVGGRQKEGLQLGNNGPEIDPSLQGKLQTLCLELGELSFESFRDKSQIDLKTLRPRA